MRLRTTGLLVGLCGIVMGGIWPAMAASDRKRPLKVAHRGGAGLAPENTLAAFQKALELRVDAVELDLHMSKDGALVVMHDAKVNQTTDGRGAIRSFMLADLRRLNAAAAFTRGRQAEPQRIPTLDEVLALVQGHAAVQIEIKRDTDQTRYPGIEARVLEAVRRFDMLGDAVVISFDFPTLREIKALEPELRTCALISTGYLWRFDVRRQPAAVASDLAAQGFDCVGIKHSRLTTQLLKAFRARGLQVGVWTVNQPSAMRGFAAMGVDFITSDRPDLLNDVLP